MLYPFIYARASGSDQNTDKQLRKIVPPRFGGKQRRIVTENRKSTPKNMLRGPIATLLHARPLIYRPGISRVLRAIRLALSLLATIFRDASMRKYVIYFIFLSFFPLLSNLCYASQIETGSKDTPGMTSTSHQSKSIPNFTVLNYDQYRKVVSDSREKIRKLLKSININHKFNKNSNDQVKFIASSLHNIPYIYTGAMGEGDWTSHSSTYAAGSVHIQQDPVYRLDGLDCQTYVQMVLALFNSHDLDKFDENYVKLAYGAAGNIGNDVVHYYNRNHFVEGDFNPLNEKNGILQAVTLNEMKNMNITITRKNWFDHKKNRLSGTVRVLHKKDGETMADRFMNRYTNLHYPNFDQQNINISYIPKEAIAKKQSDGSYLPDQALLDKIPTPAVAEIIRDPRLWHVGGKPIKDVIGTELSVSHLGIIYHQTFQKGQTIHQKITCKKDSNDKKVCSVTPVKCLKTQCRELMFSHATNSYPNNYYWYREANGNYSCTAQKPENGEPSQYCNQVTSLPLFDYLTQFEYGSYRYMESPSVAGVHIEKILRPIRKGSAHKSYFEKRY